jgi:hypothetical protein
MEQQNERLTKVINWGDADPLQKGRNRDIAQVKVQRPQPSPPPPAPPQAPKK